MATETRFSALFPEGATPESRDALDIARAHGAGLQHGLGGLLQDITDLVAEPCVVLGRMRPGSTAPAFLLRDVWLVETGFFLSRGGLALLACCVDVDVDPLGDGCVQRLPEEFARERSGSLLLLHPIRSSADSA